jgi:membrane-bound inhibitor of C-type lysozyme
MNCRFASVALIASVSLCACSSINIWPFGEKKPEQASNTPANSTAYQCSGGKKFYVRLQDNGNSAWLILPDREVSLARTGSGAAASYSNGITTLAINGKEATLEVSPGNSYADCKAAGK